VLMLKLHKDLSKAKTPPEQESLQRTIDALVYELYGLAKRKSELLRAGRSDSGYRPAKTRLTVCTLPKGATRGDVVALPVQE
jgi:hypothetical protein